MERRRRDAAVVGVVRALRMPRRRRGGAKPIADCRLDGHLADLRWQRTPDRAAAHRSRQRRAGRHPVLARRKRSARPLQRDHRTALARNTAAHAAHCRRHDRRPDLDGRQPTLRNPSDVSGRSQLLRRRFSRPVVWMGRVRHRGRTRRQCHAGWTWPRTARAAVPHRDGDPPGTVALRSSLCRNRRRREPGRFLAPERLRADARDGRRRLRRVRRTPKCSAGAPMTVLAVMVFVGAGSYLMRLLPLLLANRVRLSSTVELVLADAAVGALAALLATSVHRFTSGSLSPGLPAATGYAALGVGTVVALLGGSIGRVTLAGAATIAIAIATTTFV